MEKFGVKYMIIGGYAVGFHAEPRWTKDLDIWTATDEANALAVYSALAHFGAPLKQLEPKDFASDDAWYSFGEPPNRVDILMGPPGPKFNDAWRGRVEAEIAGQRVIFVGREDLIKLKSASGRERDVRDLNALADSAAFARKPLRKKTAKDSGRKKASKPRRKRSPPSRD
jgi:hypothetical protein